MNRQKRTRKHTFTLVELLVVLLILGVLVWLAVPRYMDVQKAARLRSFAANTREIESALETYRLSNSTGGNKYPDNLSELTSYFTQPPINPYTGKSMLSDNPEESGLRYENHDNDYTLCVTQLDIDDVNNNGNRNEPIPVASHIAKNDVGETCSVVTGTTEPFIGLFELFTIAYLMTESSLLPIIDDNKEFVNSEVFLHYYSDDMEELPLLTLDRTYISTTTITIDPTNGFQIAGDVSTNGNYMICASGCEATTKDTFMIGSNNADDSVIEFTVDIPEIKTGRIEIGLTDFYLRYDGDSHTMHLFYPVYDGVFKDLYWPLEDWTNHVCTADQECLYTGTHTFRFEFHHGKARVKMDNKVLKLGYFYERSFSENGMKFFVRNINTNAAVHIIGTIAITIDEYKFTTTGTYISPIYDISTPNFITGTTDVLVSLYNLTQLEQYTDFTLEYQLSENGGARWGAWQPVGGFVRIEKYGDGVLGVSSDFLKNISLENARIRLRVKLSTNNTKFSPEILSVDFIIENALAPPNLPPW